MDDMTGCEYCSGEIPAKPSKMGKVRRFCSSACTMQAWKKRNPVKHLTNVIKRSAVIRDRVAAARILRPKKSPKIPAWIKWREYLKSGPCMDCHHYYESCCMDFDHRPGEQKLFLISKALSHGRYTRAEIMREINKCDLVCSNCHRIRTNQRRFSAKQARMA